MMTMIIGNEEDAIRGRTCTGKSGMKSIWTHGGVKNCDRTFNSGGKKMSVPFRENGRVDQRCRR